MNALFFYFFYVDKLRSAPNKLYSCTIYYYLVYTIGSMEKTKKKKKEEKKLVSFVCCLSMYHIIYGLMTFFNICGPNITFIISSSPAYFKPEPSPKKSPVDYVNTF